MNYKYQNISNTIQNLHLSGNISNRTVAPDQIITSDVAIENPNFKFVGQDSAPVEPIEVIKQVEVTTEEGTL